MPKAARAESNFAMAGSATSVGGRGRLRVDGLTVVVGVGGHGHRLRLTAGDGLLDHDRLRHGLRRRSRGSRSWRSPSCRSDEPRAQAVTPVAAPAANEPHPQLLLSW